MKGYSAMALDVLQQALDEGPLEDVWALSAALKALDLVAQRRLAAPAQAQATPERVLGIKEAAAILGTSPDSLYRRRKVLKLGFKDGLDGRLKFSEAELSAYLGRQRRG